MRLNGLSDYSDLAVLAQYGETLVLSGTDPDHQRVILKTHAAELPSSDMRERIRREHALTTAASNPHIVEALALIDQPNRSALVLADPGTTLRVDLDASESDDDRLAGAGRLDLVGLLDVAVDVADALVSLHAAGVTHRAIDADHVARADSGGVVVDLYDACLTGQRPRRSTHGSHPAPEQGAANPSATTAATDQFALAQMIADAIDVLGLATPAGLASILDHASSPDPRSRYRSMLGLRADLVTVRDEVRQHGDCPTIQLSTDCPTLTWDEPDALIGRDAVLDEVMEHVASAAESGRARVVVIRSVAGMGRSSLVSELCDRLAEQSVVSGLGRFVDGGPTRPLHAPVEMMQQVVSLLLAAPDDLVERVRREMHDRVGSDLGLAVQVIPPLGLLIGPHPEPALGAPEDLVDRIERAAQAAITSISRCVAPLVAVFDDADRADATSLRTLELLASGSESGPMAVILSAAAGSQRLDHVLDRLRSRGTEVYEIALGPLDRGGIRELVAAGTGSDPRLIAPVADAVFARSAGSPTLALADVWRLVDEQHLFPDLEHGRWTWTDTAVEHDEPLTVDVVAQRRFEHLEPELRRVVVTAAVAGRCTTLDLLVAATELPPEVVTRLVDRAVSARVLTRHLVDDSERIVCVDNGLRRAALEQIPANEADGTRHAIARALIGILPTGDDGQPAPNADQQYALIELLRHQASLVDDDHDRKLFGRLCAEAARSAHRNAAFQEALDLQLEAIEVLGADGWRSDPDLTFELHLHAAEHALMLSRPDLVDDLIEQMRLDERSASEQVRAMRVLGTRAWIQGEHDSTLASLRALLAELDEPIPDRVTWADLAREYLATRTALLGLAPESFLAAEPITDHRVRSALDAMIGCVHLAYVDQPLTHIWLVLRGTRLTAQHGISDGSAYFLTGYGMLSLSVPGGLQVGLHYGAVGRALSATSSEGVAAMVAFAHEAFVRHWGASLESTIDPLFDGYRTAIEAQQRGYGLTGGTFALLHSLLASRPLANIDSNAADMADTFDQLGERAFLLRVEIVRQAIDDLRDGPGDAYLSGSRFDAERWLSTARGGELAVVVHTLRGLVALCFGDGDALAASTDAADRMLRTAPGQAVLAQHAFHLAVLDGDRLGRARGAVARAAARARAERSLLRLRQLARNAPTNAEHRVALVEAIVAGHQTRSGARVRAMEAYERAVARATANGALHDLGIAAERAATFHAQHDSTALARHYAAVARDAWEAWGASAVVDSIGERLPQAATLAVLSPADGSDAASTDDNADPTTETLAEASSLLGQELEVRDFLGRLIEILMRHTDATRGFLILQSGAGPIVEVAGHRVTGRIQVDAHASTDLADHTDLCVPAVNYVTRTRQVLSLIDPSADRRFRSDAALRGRSPRALLGLPVGRANATSGVLVLESDTYSHAFEPERIEALRVLSAQAISAIDQARMSSDLSMLNDDVAELRLTASELTARAETDALTGVANRAGMEARLHESIRAAHRGVSPDDPPDPDALVGVLFCDLDDFKLVNDRFGHAVGDLVLTEIATRLRSVTRSDDIVARIGGDEFVVVSVGVSTAELTRMADRALSEIARGIEVAPHGAIDVGVSIGVGHTDLGRVTSIDDVDALVHAADEAMYAAKGSGKGRVHRGGT